MERPTRTIWTSEQSGIGMHKLLEMSDEEYLELEAKHARKIRPLKKPVKTVKRGLEASIDISKIWKTASQMDKGLSPKGLGINSGGGFIR